MHISHKCFIYFFQKWRFFVNGDVDINKKNMIPPFTDILCAQM